MKINFNNTILILLVLAVVSLLGGIAGDFLFRTYIMNSIYDFPVSSEINYDGVSKNTNLIIRDPKKVIVQENEKTKETAGKVRNGLVGIYNKAAQLSIAKDKSYFALNGEAGTGCLITSDGWIITSFDGFKDQNDLVKNFVVISKDKNTYPIEQAIADRTAGITFIRIKDGGLPVRSFSDYNSLGTGDSVLALNWKDDALQTRILSLDEGKVVKNSDFNFRKYRIADDLAKDFKGAFLFDLAGNLAGMVKMDGQAEVMANYAQVLRGVIEKGEISWPSLGATYVNAEDLVGFPQKKGAVIRSVLKGGAAEAAGIKEGYVILSVDGTEISSGYQLSYAVNSHLPGESVKLNFFFRDTSGDVQVKLKEFKTDENKKPNEAQ